MTASAYGPSGVLTSSTNGCLSSYTFNVSAFPAGAGQAGATTTNGPGITNETQCNYIFYSTYGQAEVFWTVPIYY